MFFIYLLSCGAPGVVPSETIESSDLQKYKEENKILYQEKYDMKKKSTIVQIIYNIAVRKKMKLSL